MNKIIKSMIVIAASVLLAGLFCTPVFAAIEKPPSSSGWDVYVDSNGDVVVSCNDKKKTSSIYYQTVGLTFSRGQFNPPMKKLAKGAATEYFRIAIEPSKTTSQDLKNGRVQTVFRFPYAEMKSRIGGVSGEWLQEIEDAEKYGGTAFVRVDCIMVIYHGTARTGHIYRNDPTVGPYDDERRDLNPREIQAAEPWSAGANTGLRTHFHRWLPIHSGKAPMELLGPFYG